VSADGAGTPRSQPHLYHQADRVRLYLGDAADVLATLPEGSVDCVVTSPPYRGHRDYATGTWTGGDPGCHHPRPGTADTCAGCGARWVDPQYGHEDTVEDYIEHLRAVFAELRRVLTADGTCWLNLGDTYSTGRPGQAPAKNLLGVPWRVALTLQQDGWILRSEVIWHKPNAMPESVQDRLACTHEHLFLLVRSPRYHFTLDPIRLRPACPNTADTTHGLGHARTAGHSATGAPARRRNTYRQPKYLTDPAAHHGRPARGNLIATGTAHTTAHPAGRNPGTLWSIPTRPSRLPHYAAFPIDLPLRAIAAGCTPGGLVCDPFAGTSTTGVASLRLGHPYIGIDINPAYHDLATDRLLNRPHSPADRSPQDGHSDP
jgi:site-specific DNA-methyltransferase (cytosine-N4-specific)